MTDLVDRRSGSHHADGDQEIIVRPMGERAVALGPRDSLGWPAVPERVAVVARALLGLKPDAAIGGQLYELSPESIRHLSTDRKDHVGEYFLGTLRNSRGEYSHNIQIREACRPTALIDPATLLLAAQMAALQAEIRALKEIVEGIALDVRAVLDFIRVEQAADISAAVNMVNEVYRGAVRRGSVGPVDWSRVANLEHVLRKQGEQVEQELEAIRKRLVFTGRVAPDLSVVGSVDLPRLEALFKATILLEKALEQHAWLQFVHKEEVGEFDPVAAGALLERLDQMRERRQGVARAIRVTVSEAPEVRGRSWAKRLRTDGIVIGGWRDNRQVAQVRAFQTSLNAQPALRSAAVTPPAPVRLEIVGL